MPEETLLAFAEHGNADRVISPDGGDCEQVFLVSQPCSFGLLYSDSVSPRQSIERFIVWLIRGFAFDIRHESDARTILTNHVDTATGDDL